MWTGDEHCVVLLHGSGGSTHSWAGLAPLIAGRGPTVVALDLPGHAFTDRPPDGQLTLAGFADLVSALSDVLELGPRVVIGHSAGAAVALELARRDPEILGVVGLCPSLLSGREVPNGLFPGLLARSVRSPFAARLAAGLVRRTRGLDQVLASTGSAVPESSARLYRRLTSASAHVNATLTLFSQWRPSEIEARLPTMRAPCLLVAGGKDDWIPVDDVRRAAELLPAARMVTLDGLGHLAHEEAPARVDDVIAPFLVERFAGRVMPPPPRPDGQPRPHRE